MHTEESLMALADFAIGHQVRVAYGQRPCNASESRNALRLAIREVLKEIADARGIAQACELRAERAEAESLQRGNVIGRITAHLLGNKNNVTDEDVVIAAAEVGRELQGARERIERLQALVAPHEPVEWPKGLRERIRAASERFVNGQAPRRIPADPTDADLVLAEIGYLLDGNDPPFWVAGLPKEPLRLPAAPAPCIGNDPACPCQDGDLCHYKDSLDGKTKAMKPAAPAPEPVAWMVYTQDGKSVFVTDNPTDIPPNCTALPLFTESKA